MIKKIIVCLASYLLSLSVFAGNTLEEICSQAVDGKYRYHLRKNERILDFALVQSLEGGDTGPGIRFRIGDGTDENMFYSQYLGWGKEGASPRYNDVKKEKKDNGHDFGMALASMVQLAYMNNLTVNLCGSSPFGTGALLGIELAEFPNN
jgi:hypothetical protein